MPPFGSDLHCHAKFPRDDVAGEVVEDGGEVIPALPNDLETGKVCLSQLIGYGGVDNIRLWLVEKATGNP